MFIRTAGRALLPVALLTVAAPFAGADEPVRTFSGRDNRYNLMFNVEGGWELRWNAEGDTNFPGISHFEVHLYDAFDDTFHGVLVRKRGTGAGVEYVAEGGRFRADVLGSNVEWQIEIVDLEDPEPGP